jgi:hypothetical protein
MGAGVDAVTSANMPFDIEYPSDWDILLLVLGIVGPIAAAAVGAHLSPGTDVLTRRAFTRKYWFLSVVMLLVGLFAAMPGADLVLSAIWAAVIGYWAAARLRDMGQDKYRATWTGVPIVGFFYSLHLMWSKDGPAPSTT